MGRSGLDNLPRTRRQRSALRTPLRLGVALLAGVLVLGPLTVTTAGASASRTVAPKASASWHASLAPVPTLPPDPLVSINAMECPAAGGCVAVGSFLASAGFTEGLVESESNGHWTAAPAPLPLAVVARASELISVSCTAPGSCSALGEYLDPVGNIQGEILTESGKTWSAIRAPLPTGVTSLGGGALEKIVCRQAKSCVAVGVHAATDGSNVHTFVMVETAGKWAAITPPLPTGVAPSSLNDLLELSCGANGSCLAVGNYLTGGQAAHGYLLYLSHGAWKAVKEPLPAGVPAVADTNLNADSCVSASSCTAVGLYQVGSKAPHVLVVNETGTTFTATSPSLPADDAKADSEIDYVSCVGAGSCTATGAALTLTQTNLVGHVLILSEAAGHWTAQDAPSPAGVSTAGDIGQPAGVACNRTGCVASELELSGLDLTGSSTGSDIGSVILSKGATGGWKASLPGVPGGRGALPSVDAVACPATGGCQAGGNYLDTAGNAQGLLVSPTAKGWASSEAPVPVGAGLPTGSVYMSSIKCPASGSCTALGEVDNFGTGAAVSLVAETLNHGTWSDTFIALPHGASAPQVALNGALVNDGSCRAVGSCVGAGSYGDSKGNAQGLVFNQSGNAWTAKKAPLPSKAAVSQAASVDAITCTGVAACTAVGTYVDSAGHTQAMVLTESAGTWKAAEAPLPEGLKSLGDGAFFSSIACATAGSCAAVGNIVGAGQGTTIVLGESGGAWHAAVAPLPAGAATGQNAGSFLAAVACPATGNCVATGAYLTASGDQPALLETYSAGAWKAAAAPQPANAATAGNGEAAEVDAIACTSATSCTATGDYTDAFGFPEGEILSRSGTKWSAATSPLPSGVLTVGLTGLAIEGVACPKAGSCAAVGVYVIPTANGQGTPQGLLLTQSGSHWTAVKAPLPGGASNLGPDGNIGDISCPAVGSCVAIGVFDNGGGVPTGMFETLSS